uniref:C2 domain-containing protein n=1 Tax=Ananas comosus var. bracteatus TaxID=296719 RepID=A0A6V7QRN0_ANACO
MECTESRDLLLHCEINSITITNLRGGAVTPGSTKLFVRCFVAAGSGNRIRIDTREAHVGATDPDSAHWAEPASLQCLGPSNVINAALQEGVGVVFELRRRKSGPILGRGSELMGRAELTWRDVAGDVEKRIGLCGPGGLGSARVWCVGAEDVFAVACDDDAC